MSSGKASFTSQSPKLSSFHGTLLSAFKAGDPNVDSKPAERVFVEAIQKMYDCLARGDIDAMMQHFTPDVVADLCVPDEFPFIRHAEGVDEVRKLILHNFQLIEAEEPWITCVVAQGDTVMLTLQERGINRATGAPYSIQATQRFTF